MFLQRLATEHLGSTAEANDHRGLECNNATVVENWWSGGGDYGNWEATLTLLSRNNPVNDGNAAETPATDGALPEPPRERVARMDQEVEKDPANKPTTTTTTSATTESGSVTNESGTKVGVPSIRCIDNILTDAPLFSEEEFEPWVGAMEAGLTNQSPHDIGLGSYGADDMDTKVNSVTTPRRGAVTTTTTTKQPQNHVPSCNNTGLAVAAAAAFSANHLLASMDSVDNSIKSVRSCATVTVSSDGLSGLRKDEITDRDVPCGRGGFVNHHPGAKNLRALVAPVRRHYQEETRTKDEKTAISQRIVDEIERTGGRFLKENKKTGRWFTVSNKKARNKVAQACREKCLTCEARAAKRKKWLAAKKKREQQN